MFYILYNFKDMKLFNRAVVILMSTACLIFASCKTMALNAVSSGLAGSDKKGVPAKVKPDAPDPMMAFMGEEDPVIVKEVLPTLVKIYEIMHIENPTHQGNTIMCGTLNVMYANLCVQQDADAMTDPRLLDMQVEEYNRAKYHYLKGRDLIFSCFEERWPGFTKAILGSDEEAYKKMAAKITANDVTAAYWACAGFFASFALDPLDSDAIGCLKGHLAILERAAELAPEYSNGSIWDVMCQVYAAAPMDFGGDMDRAVFCYNKAQEVAKGKSAGLYLTYAETFCKPEGDKKAFVDALEKALAIDPKADPSNTLMTVISQKKAKRLMAHLDDYFIDWGDEEDEENSSDFE